MMEMKATRNWMKKGRGGRLTKGQQYIFNLGIMVSQVTSTILGGDPDETISSRCGKASKCGNHFASAILEPTLNFIFMDEKHCEEAIEADRGDAEIWDWCKYTQEKDK